MNGSRNEGPPDPRTRTPADPDTRTPAHPDTHTSDPPPPFGGSWNRLYAIVLGELALLVVLFWVFTKVFS